MRFSSGTIVCTRRIKALTDANPMFGAFVQECIGRHLSCDWGDITEDDREMNDESVRQEKEGGSPDALMSSYNLGDENVWIITEGDRSVTTVLFPDEY